MTIAVRSGYSNYIFLTSSQFYKRGGAAERLKFLDETKESILQQHIVNLQNHINKVKNNATIGLDSTKKRMVERYLSGDWAKGFQSLYLQETHVFKKIDGNKLIKKLEKCNRNHQDLIIVCGEIKTFLENNFKQSNFVNANQQYIQAIIDEYKKDSRLGLTGVNKSSSAGIIEARVLSQFISHGSSNTAIFKTRNVFPKNDPYKNTIIKLMTAVSLIGQIDIDAMDQAELHIKYGSCTKDWETRFIHVVSQWMKGIIATDAEMANLSAFCRANKEYFENLFQAENTGEKPSSVTYRLDRDKNLENFYKELEEFSKIQGNNGAATTSSFSGKKIVEDDVTYKSDVTPDKILSQAGISVKDYTPQVNKNLVSQIGHLDIQSGSSLLTYLLRECRVDSSQLLSIMNLAAVVDPNDISKDQVSTITQTDRLSNYQSEVNACWDSFKEWVNMKSLLSTLTGIDKMTQGQAIYMSLNGRLIPMEIILKKIKDKSHIITAHMSVSGENGFDRTSYVNINKNSIIKANLKTNPDAPAQRSNIVRPQILATFQNKKVTSYLNIHDLSLL